MSTHKLHTSSEQFVYGPPDGFTPLGPALAGARFSIFRAELFELLDKHRLQLSNTIDDRIGVYDREEDESDHISGGDDWLQDLTGQIA